MNVSQSLWATYGVLRHTHCEKVFPNVQREHHVFQLALITSDPVTGHHWKKAGCIFFTPSFQLFIYIDKIPTEPSPAWARLNWTLLPYSCCISALVKVKLSLDVFAPAEKLHGSSMNRTCLPMCQSSNILNMLKPDISAVVLGKIFSLRALDGESPSKKKMSWQLLEFFCGSLQATYHQN